MVLWCIIFCFLCGILSSVYIKKIAAAFGLAMTGSDGTPVVLFEKTKPIFRRANQLKLLFGRNL
jgi:hypothetical protein